MDKDKFLAYINEEHLLEFTDNQQILALYYVMKKKWEKAHVIVQDGNSEIDFWIHALIHKVEGDIGNSKYWYLQAGRKYVQEKSVEDEVFEILDCLDK